MSAGTPPPDRYDVIATNIKTGTKRVMVANRSGPEAVEFIKFAIYRRGCDEEFYSSVPAGSVKNG